MQVSTGMSLTCECDVRRLTPAEEAAAAAAAACRTTTTPSPQCMLQAQSIEAANARCETCRFIDDHREKMVLRAITLIFLLLELMMAIGCLAVEVVYEICGTYIRYYVRNPNETNVHVYIVYTRLTYMTITSFLFVFIPVIMLALLITRKFCVFCFMAFMLGIIGFSTYLAVSIITFVKAKMDNANMSAFQGFAVLCLITSLLFLAHAGYEIWKFFFKGDCTKPNAN